MFWLFSCDVPGTHSYSVVVVAWHKPSSHGRVSPPTRIPHCSGSPEGTVRGRWQRNRRLHGAVCAAMAPPPCSVEKNEKENGVPTCSRHTSGYRTDRQKRGGDIWRRELKAIGSTNATIFVVGDTSHLPGTWHYLLLPLSARKVPGVKFPRIFFGLP